MKSIKILVLVLFTSFSAYSHASNEFWDTIKCILWDDSCSPGWSHWPHKKEPKQGLPVSKKVIYFLWVGQTNENRETEIIRNMRSWKALNPEFDVNIYSSHPFTDLELNKVRYSLDSLNKLVPVFSRQEPPHIDLGPHVNALRNKAQLDTISPDQTVTDTRVARQILADLYRFLLLKGTYHEREYAFFSEVNNTPFKIEDSRLSEQSLYLVGPGRIAFLGLRIGQLLPEQYLTNVITTYLKNIKWYVDNMNVLSLSEKDLSFLFTPVSSYNQLFLPSPKISNIAEAELEHTQHATKSMITALTQVYNKPYFKLFWQDKDRFIINLEYTTPKLLNNLNRYSGRDGLFLIKNWIDSYDDTDKKLFEVPDDTQFKRENLVITRYLKVIVTAMRKNLIRKTVNHVQNQIKKGNLQYKQAFEGTAFVDYVALTQKFDDIYATYLNELTGSKINKMNDLKKLTALSGYFKGAREDRVNLNNKTSKNDEDKFTAFELEILKQQRKLLLARKEF